MLITVGKKQIILNPACIVSFHLAQGRATAFLKGENVEGVLKISDLTVREPWSVVINTTTSTHYINCATFEQAMYELVNVIKEVYKPDDETLAKYKIEMEKTYGKKI